MLILTFQTWKKQINCVSLLQVFYTWYCLMCVTHCKLHSGGQWGVQAVSLSWWVTVINSSKPAVDGLHQLKSWICFLVMNTKTTLKLGYFFDSIHPRMGAKYYASSNKVLLIQLSCHLQISRSPSSSAVPQINQRLIFISAQEYKPLSCPLSLLSFTSCSATAVMRPRWPNACCPLSVL